MPFTGLAGPLIGKVGIHGLPGTEDSALSVVALVLASRGEGALGNFQLCQELMGWAAKRFARCPLAASGSGITPFGSLFQHVGTTPESVEPVRPINSFAAEFFAAGILKRLGMLSSSARIITAKEARALPGRFVVKAISPVDRRLHFISGEVIEARVEDDVAVLVSEPVPDAASFDFFRRKILKPSEDRFASGSFGAFYVKSEYAQLGQIISKILAIVCGKTAEEADDLFAGFNPTPAEIAVIQREARWDGPQFLKVCAARTFIGCGYAHGGNFLVARSGQLISVDHTSANYESGEDLRQLFRWTAKGTRAFEILREIGKLTEDDVKAAIAEIPRHPSCGDVSPLGPYYIARLRKWKELAGIGALAAATASPAD